jgi:Zn-dependent protease with chaperone function
MQGNPVDPAAAQAEKRADLHRAIVDAVEINLPEIDAVSNEYKIAVIAAALFLLAQFSILVALAGGLTWGLFAMVANFAKSPGVCFWGIIVDAGTLLFLIKPFFFRPPKLVTGHARVVHRDDEPLLYEFIEKLCNRINAPAPETIVLSLSPDASARMKSPLTGKMELTLGLPLLSVFPLQVLMAVVAHELGHFRQRGAMRLSHLVFLVHGFINRVLYQRDTIDDFFRRSRQINNVYFIGAKLLIYVAVESMRGLLWMLLVSGSWLTFRVHRQMEFDADRFAAKLAGRIEMAKVLEAMEFVVIGARQAMEDAREAMQERALPDDMVRLAVADALSMVRYKDELVEKLRNDRTRWDSDHPCLLDRLFNIADIQATGMLNITTPSNALLGDFRTVCRNLSRQFYETQLGDLRKRIATIDARELASSCIRARRGRFNVQGYFRTGVGISRRMLPMRGSLVRTKDTQQAIAQLKEIRAKMLAFSTRVDIQSGPEMESLEEYRTVVRGHIAALEQIMTMVWKVYRHANLAGIKRSRKRLIKVAEKVEQRINVLSGDIHPLDALSRKRIDLVISLLHSPASMAAGTNLSRLRAQAAGIARRADAIEHVTGLAVQMRERATRLEIFSRNYSPTIRRALAEPIHLAATTLAADAEQFFQEFHTRPELMKMAEEQAAVGRIVPTQVIDPNNLGELRRYAMAAMAYLSPLVAELQAKTASLAEAVESALDMEPLPHPLFETAERRAALDEERQKKAQKYWIFNGLRAAGGLVVLGFIIHLILTATAR